MRELSLFTGAGGGLLGTHLLGWRTIGYVEWDDYCQRVLAQRMKEEHIDRAPIFGDLRTFNHAWASCYRDLAEVVTAGFPCQPFSVAGDRAGEEDSRNMWPDTIECIRLVRPRYALLENVPGLLVSGYFGRILGDLAESGYDCRWRILSAAELGAPHKRDRLWIIANCYGTGRGQQRGAEPARETHGTVERGGWWSIEPEVGRVAHGMANRVDQLRALGNGQVPAVAAAVWRLLTSAD